MIGYRFILPVNFVGWYDHCGLTVPRHCFFCVRLISQLFLGKICNCSYNLLHIVKIVSHWFVNNDFSIKSNLCLSYVAALCQQIPMSYHVFTFQMLVSLRTQWPIIILLCLLVLRWMPLLHLWLSSSVNLLRLQPLKIC